MTKVAFFYANGTAYPPRDPVGLFKMITPLFGPAPKPPGLLVIPGLDGHNIGWMDGSPQNDPFPAMLDPDIFTAVKVEYPAWSFPMNMSIGKLVDSTKALIGDLPKGQKFGIGGWSQGAAAMSTVYNEIRSGSLQSRASDFIGGVAFGNPRRQLNYRGEVGGTYSGAWNVPSTTAGLCSNVVHFSSSALLDKPAVAPKRSFGMIRRESYRNPPFEARSNRHWQYSSD